ncbi:hypothetical protein [Actinophytocola sp. NPDC049390]|uniref:hypothetical protein n=1 Tax=Actinophytocola sp. NPDC049390 TaxID=3363894 RepID=UPI0037AE8F6E
MSGPIRYEFSALGDGQAQLAASANEIGAEKDTWMQTVGLTMETWLDGAGGLFGELNTIWDKATQATNDFQMELSTKVGIAQMNGQQALDAAKRAVGG